MRILYTLIIGIFILSSCNMGSNKIKPLDKNSYKHHVKVVEVMQTNSYTYLKVAEYGQEYWMAVNAMDAKVGDDFYYDESMEMKGFKSKQLERVFERILFVDDLSRDPQKTNLNSKVPEDHNAQPKMGREYVSIEPIQGGISIADLYKTKIDLADKPVMVRGVVVKVNSDIMNMNWVHLQDGSSHNNNYDLTITTNEVVTVGDTVTFEGIVNLDKDFGYGYAYDLLLSEAKIK